MGDSTCTIGRSEARAVGSHAVYAIQWVGMSVMARSCPEPMRRHVRSWESELCFASHRLAWTLLGAIWRRHLRAALSKLRLVACKRHRAEVGGPEFYHVGAVGLGGRRS